MTLVAIGPVTNDLIIVGDKKESKTGGAVYFQSFVFEEFFDDYMVIVNGSDESLINEFPDLDKVKLIKKDDTHYFINHYPDINNNDIRIQSSNFADIPITKNDLEGILPDEIDAFILNPLNAYDFPLETIDYLKNFNVPIYMSIQGFLRYSGEKIDEDNYSIALKNSDETEKIISSVEALFLDESEYSILVGENDINDFNISEIIITNGSKGSRIISDKEYKIEAVKCDNVIDSTGCGDTYMAAYISKKLTTKSVLKSANFASKIASDKLSFFGPYKPVI